MTILRYTLGRARPRNLKSTQPKRGWRSAFCGLLFCANAEFLCPRRVTEEKASPIFVALCCFIMACSPPLVVLPTAPAASRSAGSADVCEASVWRASSTFDPDAQQCAAASTPTAWCCRRHLLDSQQMSGRRHSAAMPQWPPSAMEGAPCTRAAFLAVATETHGNPSSCTSVPLVKRTTCLQRWMSATGWSGPSSLATRSVLQNRRGAVRCFQSSYQYEARAKIAER